MAGVAPSFWWSANRQPINEARLRTWPRHGMNISGMLVNTKANIRATIQRFKDCGVQVMDVNWYSSLWPGVDCLPWRMPAPGQRFDLFDWNPQFFDRAQEIIELANAAGIVVQGTFWETYQSNRKKGSGVPDANVGPWRFNVNGIKLWEPYDGDRKSDDLTLTQLIPTPVCREFIPLILKIWKPHINPVRLMNEGPEKHLQRRLAALVKQHAPDAIDIVNRQEDTPGQYDNSDIGTAHARIEYHGAKLKTVEDLTRVWPSSDSHVPTFQAMLNDPRTEKWRITFSSDGARSGPEKDGPDNPYEWAPLRRFFRDVKRQGCSVLHQSRAKMTPFPNHDMIESDWFESVISG